MTRVLAATAVLLPAAAAAVFAAAALAAAWSLVREHRRHAEETRAECVARHPVTRSKADGFADLRDLPVNESAYIAAFRRQLADEAILATVEKWRADA